MRGHRQSIITVIMMMLWIAAAFLFSYCGSDGTETSTSTGGGGGTPADVSGTWTITETVDRRVCGGVVETDPSYQITVTQNGNNITVTTEGNTFPGTVNGNVVAWTGQYFEPDDNGWVTVKSMSVTVSGNNLAGSASWDFRSTQTGPVVCSGTTNIQGVKSSTPPPPPSPMTGTWNIVTVGTDNGCGEGIFPPFDLSIIQTGNSLSGSVGGDPYFAGGALAGQNAGWIASYPSGTFTITENYTVAVSGNFNSFTGKDTWNASQGTSVICTQVDQIQGTKK